MHPRMLLFVAPITHLRGLPHPLLISPRRSAVCTRRNITQCAAHTTPADSLLRHAVETSELAPELTSNQLNAFTQLTELLLAENTKYNLTAIRTPEAVITKHILDALTLLPTLHSESPRRLIDVGTGAGFPGLVLAIARPDWHLTLLDSVRKKTAFQKLAVSQLGLRNVRSVWARAEDAARDPDFREHFCVSLARSVAEFRVLAELTLPFVRVGGCLVAQKSIDEDQTELINATNSIHKCGGFEPKVEYVLPQQYYRVETSDTGDEKERRKAIIVVRKTHNTPSTYPRKPGVPKKFPL